MGRRPVFDPQVAARSRAMSTLAGVGEYVPPRRYRSASHLVESWLKLESLCASARSWIGPMLEQLDLGWVDIGAHAPEGYDPLDDLVALRGILRHCIEESSRVDAWGHMHIQRPRAHWLAWWHMRCASGDAHEAARAVNEAIVAGDVPGAHVHAGRMESYARAVDGIIEGELFTRRLLVRNHVRSRDDE